MNKMEWVFSAVLDNPGYKTSHKDTQCLVWGTGGYGEAFARIMERMDVLPIAFMDSDVNKQGKMFHGIIIKNPERALAEYGNADVILAMTDSKAKSLRDKLEKMGRKAITLMDFLLEDANDFSVLEIGPLHNPCFKGKNVKYMDVMDAQGLLDKAGEHGLPIENVPQYIDYVSTDGTWDVVKEKFDLVYSSHLLEHQTNLIQHLQDVYEHVLRGGAYILVIPDKRYCFDHFAPCTTIEDVLSAYYEKRRRHCLTALLRAARATHNDTTRHWLKDHGSKGIFTKEKLKDVVETYFASLHGDYVDAHEWYFTPETFRDICKELQELDLLKFENIEITETQEGQNVFYVRLCK